MTSPSGTFGLYESRVIQVRCAGSTDNHRFRTSTCPSEDCGIDVSFQRNSSPVNLPAGRTFKIHWRFLLLVIECPHSLNRLSASLSFVLWESLSEHGSATFRLFFCGLVLDHVPVLNQNSVLDSHNVC